MWTSFVDLIRLTVFAAAHRCGGSLGAGIIAVSALFVLRSYPSHCAPPGTRVSNKRRSKR